MANFSSSDFKRYGPQILTTSANRIGLVKGPLKADTYAAFVAKLVANAALIPADITYSDVGNDLQVSIAEKAGIPTTAAAVIGDDLCVAIYDTVNSKVYIVVDAVNRVITTGGGDAVTIPAFTHLIRELTAV